MIDNLIKLANALDESGFKKEADRVDALIKKANPLALPLLLPVVLEAIGLTLAAVALAAAIAYVLKEVYFYLKDLKEPTIEDIEEGLNKEFESDEYKYLFRKYRTPAEHDKKPPNGWGPEGQPPRGVIEIIIVIIATIFGVGVGRKILTDKSLETEREVGESERIKDEEGKNVYRLDIASYLNISTGKRVYYVGFEIDPGYVAQTGSSDHGMTSYLDQEVDWSEVSDFAANNYVENPRDLKDKALSYINIDYLDAISVPYEPNGDYGPGLGIVRLNGSEAVYGELDKISIEGIACSKVKGSPRGMPENRTGLISYGLVKEAYGMSTIAKKVVSGYSKSLQKIEERRRKWNNYRDVQVPIEDIPEDKIVGRNFQVIRIYVSGYGKENLTKVSPQKRDYLCSDVVLP